MRNLFIYHLSLVFLIVFLLIPSSWAQQPLDKVEGKITRAEDGSPITGATVQVKGKAKGAISDQDGNYLIQNIETNDTIEVRFYGRKTQQKAVNGQSTLNFALEEEIMGIDEVVVVGYGTQKKSDLTGAVSSVKMEDVESLPVSSLGQALQGRVAGVTVTQSTGSPGAGLDITIRGAGTINNSSPLYVVDGIVVDNIDYLSMADIASTEVLKDAAAVAVYGARAANGVILITTRQGTAGKTQISLSSQVSQTDYWKTIEVMPTEEYFLLTNLASLNPQNALVQIKRLETGISEAGNNNWIDVISRQGYIQNHSFAISGGSQSVRYRLSGTWFDNIGIIQGTDYQRQTILADITTQPFEKMRFRLNVIYSGDERNRLNEGDNSIVLRALRDAPTTTLFNEEGNLNGTPFRQVSTGRNARLEDTYQIKGFLDYSINENLTATTQFSLDREFFEEEVYNVSSSTDPTRFNFDTPGRYTGGLSSFRNTNGERFKWVWQSRLNFSYQWSNHSLTGVGAFEMENQSLENSITQGRSALGNDSLRQNLAAVSTQYLSNGSLSEWSNVGAVGRVSYGYQNRYLLQVNFRADGSSRFTGQKWGYFPSISAGWVISGENFMGRRKEISFLKLRASWGQSGNNRIDNFAFATRVNNGFRAVFGEDDVVDGAVPTTLANRLISWEKTTSTNIGMDLILFNRFELNLDVFEKYTSDMLIRVPIVPSAGLSNAPLRNAGDVRNQGMEVVANYRIRNQVAGKEFRADVGGNFTYILNEVVSLGERNEPVLGNDIVRRGATGNFGIVTRAEVDQPIGSFYGWITDGIFRSEEEIQNSSQADVAIPGDVRFKDLNGDGVIDEADRTYLGSPMPDFTYGIISNFSWGKFDLAMSWQGVYGQDVFNISKFYLMGFNGSNALAGTLQNFWHTGYFDNVNPFSIDQLEISEADIAKYQQLYPANTEANLPRLTTGSNDLNQNYRPSDFYLEDASYLRLKNLQLSYNLQSPWLKKLGLENAKIYLMGQNLLTFTHYTGLDPEIGKRSDTSADTNLNFGLDLANYPQARTYTLGINLSF